MAEFTYTRFENTNIPEKHQVLEWLDEVNKISGDRYRIQGYKVRYGLFYQKSKIIYELICNYQGCSIGPGHGAIEVQVINLGSCWSSTINEIMAFLIGYVNGHKDKIKSLNVRGD